MSGLLLSVEDVVPTVQYLDAFPTPIGTHRVCPPCICARVEVVVNWSKCKWASYNVHHTCSRCKQGGVGDLSPPVVVVMHWGTVPGVLQKTMFRFKILDHLECSLHTSVS